MSAPNFAKRKRMKQAENSSPDHPPPLAKSKSSRGFAETIPPEKCFRKTESALYSCFRPFPLEKLCALHRGASAQRMHD